jgi:hypothetical protein
MYYVCKVELFYEREGYTREGSEFVPDKKKIDMQTVDINQLLFTNGNKNIFTMEAVVKVTAVQ